MMNGGSVQEFPSHRLILLPAVNHTPGKVCLAPAAFAIREIPERGRAVNGGIGGGTMAISDIPILSMLRTRLSWAQERQRVLAENVSNSDTPNYRARDLVPPKFEDPSRSAPAMLSAVTLTRTGSGHINGMATSGSSFRTETKGNYDVRPTGNAVHLEDEMMKVAANQMDFQAATALYTRSLGLLKIALGKR